MAITSAFTTSFKAELFQGIHNLTAGTGHTLKIALYSSAATLGAATTAYSATNEISGAGYTAGGVTLTSITPTTNGTAGVCDFNDASWLAATIMARGCLIYNTSAANRACAVIDFGADVGATSADFTLVFPAATSAAAIIRIN